MIEIPRLIVAGAVSGTGKTTITTGIVAALRSRGIKVQPYKCGPDYIDPGYHSLAAGVKSKNLDSWMLSRPAMIEVFQRGMRTADVAIIEGVMGLYDGRSGKTGEGSTAEIARWLNSPVLLVVDVAKTSQSAAATVLGFKNYDPEINLVGVILNQVGSNNHLQSVKEAIEAATGIPVVGHVPRNEDVRLPERHLGLIPTVEQKEISNAIDRIRHQIEQTVDLDRVLALARAGAAMDELSEHKLFPDKDDPKMVNIGVAQDEAFSFYYQDSLDLIAAWGANLIPVSPLHDRSLPEDIHGLYLGGGFPEMFGEALAENYEFKSAIKKAHKAGLPIYAECGGLMYLSDGIVDFQGNRFAMVGLVPGWSHMQSKRVRLSYVQAEVLRNNVVAEQGWRLKGHEFHWSELEPPPLEKVAYNYLEPGQRLEGYVSGNLLATYLHLHFASDTNLVRRLILSCLKWQGRK